MGGMRNTNHISRPEPEQQEPWVKGQRPGLLNVSFMVSFVPRVQIDHGVESCFFDVASGNTAIALSTKAPGWARNMFSALPQKFDN